MSFCLMMMMQNSAHWLKLHLPAMLQANAIDCLVTLDGGSTDDSREYIKGLGGYVFERPFDWNFSTQANTLIEACESLKLDSCIRLDPDEMIWCYEINAICDLLKTYKLVRQSRLNFWLSRRMYSPYPYPDWQSRAWRLNMGIRYEGRVHEQLNWQALGWRDQIEVVQAPHLPIYHYGDCIKRALTHYNYWRIQNNLPTVTELPIDTPDNFINPSRFSIPYAGPQPIDPDTVGEWAPFDNVNGDMVK